MGHLSHLFLDVAPGTAADQFLKLLKGLLILSKLGQGHSPFYGGHILVFGKGKKFSDKFLEFRREVRGLRKGFYLKKLTFQVLNLILYSINQLRIL